jgi:hypothetical protein
MPSRGPVFPAAIGRFPRFSRIKSSYGGGPQNSIARADVAISRCEAKRSAGTVWQPRRERIDDGLHKPDRRRNHEMVNTETRESWHLFLAKQ